MSHTRELPEDWVRPANTRLVPAAELRVGDQDAMDGDVVEGILPAPWHSHVGVKWASMRCPAWYRLNEDVDVVSEHWAEKVLRQLSDELRIAGPDWLFNRLNRLVAEARAVEAHR